MGTNFYWKEEMDKVKQIDGYKWDELQSMSVHIGKRSAAGLYCWDCGTTLCKSGTHEVHGSDTSWYDVCPSCGKTPKKEENLGAAGVELGFRKTTDREGVVSCSSFTWTMLKHKTMLASLYECTEKKVQDEYGREYTPKEFLDMVEGCPIQFQTPREFS